MEAEGRLAGLGQTAPVTQGLIEHDEGADEVGLHELAGSVDRTIDMAFSGEVGDDVRLEILQDASDSLGVADVGLDEAVAVAPRCGLKRAEQAGIGQLVENQHLVIAVFDQSPH